VKISFDKMQGLGNDFVFVEESQLTKNLDERDIKFLCDRKFGIGCDTLVVYQRKNNEINARFFNSDGSEAEICVNASRCLALLMEKNFGIFELNLKTKSKNYKTKIVDEKIFVNVGRPSFSLSDLGIENENIDVDNLLNDLDLTQNEISYIDRACAISVGNPHLILFLKKSIPQKLKQKIGEKLEKFSLFKNRINVSFAKIINELEIQLEVFERGVGFTLACGSGASATAFSAYKLKLMGDKIRVKQPGGNLEIFIKSDDSIIQKGSANYVFKGEISIDSNNDKEKIPGGKLKIYTDGACSGNPGPGGWGAIIIGDDGEVELCGGESETTNNRMELLGPINALKKIPEGAEIEIFTDSSYVKNGITSWIKNWEKNGWKTSSKGAVKNKELWIELQNQIRRHEVTWRWVKGHAGDHYNERADELARSKCKK
jgi:ribonuclease HI